MERTILHCDCNSFFASVETVLEPSYAHVPMAVCGSEEVRHGIVLAKNELAKRYGIVTAETVHSAKRKCPQLVTVSPHYNEYVRFSRMVSVIYARYTDMIEPFGIDESWLDVTASRKLFGDGMAIAERIRTEVKATCGLTVSIGVSFNKIFAKLGSDYKKPDAITEISRDNFEQIVYPLPVGQLLFVGRKTEEMLRRMGILTIGDLARCDEEALTRRFGKLGDMLVRYARGEDNAPVQTATEPAKSISNGYTFSRNLTKAEECRHAIDFLTEEIGAKLRMGHLTCSTVTLKVKDELLKTYQKQHKLLRPTNSTRAIAEAAFSLYQLLWEPGRPIRMMTVGVSGLSSADTLGEQMSFFEDPTLVERRQRDGKRDVAVDSIRGRFGSDSIMPAAILTNDFGLLNKKKK